MGPSRNGTVLGNPTGPASEWPTECGRAGASIGFSTASRTVLRDEGPKLIQKSSQTETGTARKEQVHPKNRVMNLVASDTAPGHTLS